MLQVCMTLFHNKKCHFSLFRWFPVCECPPETKEACAVVAGLIIDLLIVDLRVTRCGRRNGQAKTKKTKVAREDIARCPQVLQDLSWRSTISVYSIYSRWVYVIWNWFTNSWWLLHHDTQVAGSSSCNSKHTYTDERKLQTNIWDLLAKARWVLQCLQIPRSATIPVLELWRRLTNRWELQRTWCPESNMVEHGGWNMTKLTHDILKTCIWAELDRTWTYFKCMNLLLQHGCKMNWKKEWNQKCKSRT